MRTVASSVERAAAESRRAKAAGGRVLFFSHNTGESERLQEVLKDRVKEVRVTARLVDSPSCVVVGQNDLSPHLQRMLKAAGQEAPNVLPVLEINPEHALVARVQAASDETFNDWAALLFEQAMLADGSQLPDPTAFVKRVNQLLLG